MRGDKCAARPGQTKERRVPFPHGSPLTLTQPSKDAHAAAMSRLPGSFYGWHVVGAAFVAQFISNFCTLAGIGPFFTVIEREFGTNASTISNAVGGSILLMGLAGPLVGRALDRGNQRAIMLAGVVVVAFFVVTGEHAAPSHYRGRSS